MFLKSIAVVFMVKERVPNKRLFADAESPFPRAISVFYAQNKIKSKICQFVLCAGCYSKAMSILSKAKRIAIAFVAIIMMTVLASCGDDKKEAANAPAFTEELARSVDNFNRDKPFRNKIAVSFSGTANGQATPEIKKALGNKYSFSVETNAAGDYQSADAVIAYDIGNAKNQFKIKSLNNQAFIEYKGKWYALSLDNSQLPTDPALQGETINQATSAIRSFGKNFVTAKAVEGPDLGGETWQYDLGLNTQGIMDLAQTGGALIEQKDRQTLEVLKRLVSGKVVIGKDHRLRRAELTFKASKDELNELVKEAEKSSTNSPEDQQALAALRSIDELQMTMSFDLGGYGEPTEVVAPPEPYGTEDEFTTLAQQDLMEWLSKNYPELSPLLENPNPALTTTPTFEGVMAEPTA